MSDPTDPKSPGRVLGNIAGNLAAAGTNAVQGNPAGIGRNLGEAAGTATSSVPVVGDVVSNANKVLSVIGAPGFWKRVGVGLLGLWLIYLGVIIILANTEAVRTGVKGAVGVASKGII